MKLLLPKRVYGEVLGINITPKQGERIYFLAGPIRGADDWQKEAVKLLAEKDPHCYVACPRRYDESHELYHLSESVQGSILHFSRQTLWERYYLDRAARSGCIIFWLPCESATNPRKKEDGPYARDTYGELARWSMCKACTVTPDHYKFFDKERPEHVNIAIGAEGNFPGLDVIYENFTKDNCGFQFCGSLDAAVNEGVRLGKEVNRQPFSFND
ncbi:MAG TPA: hypothetical protein VL576_00405 [Candidatus Paceibacterota bacterium]|jgi:hypothetical protein|nr:hypothetical protein [Candidatus Paceibacterota bacterium]